MTATTRRTFLAGIAVAGAAVAVGVPARPATAGAPSILKPLPAGPVRRLRHQRRDALGLGRPATLPDPAGAALRPQPHRSRRRSTATPGGCGSSATGCAAARAEADARLARLRDLRRLPVTRITVDARVHRQRPQLLRQPAGHAGVRHRLDARRGRRGRAGRASGSRDVLRRIGLEPPTRSRSRPPASTRATSAAAWTTAAVRRPFPIAKALDDALLAWGMNGEPLLPDHGYPLRLVLPGWVGIASIKWLGSLEVADTELTSPWNTKWYRMTGGDLPGRQPAADRQPGALGLGAARGTPRSRPATKVVLTGRSWSGGGADPPGRGQHRRRRDLAAGRRSAGRGRREAWTPVVASPGRARAPASARADGPRHRRRRRAPSRSCRRSTTTATSSTPSCGTRSPH